MELPVGLGYGVGGEHGVLLAVGGPLAHAGGVDLASRGGWGPSLPSKALRAKLAHSPGPGGVGCSVDNQQRGLEFLKLYYDYFKHQTTLSATTAVVLVALLRDQTPLVSLILLGISTVAALRGMLNLVGRLAAVVSGNLPTQGGIGVALVRLHNVAWTLWIAAIVSAVVAAALGWINGPDCVPGGVVFSVMGGEQWSF